MIVGVFMHDHRKTVRIEKIVKPVFGRTLGANAERKAGCENFRRRAPVCASVKVGQVRAFVTVRIEQAMLASVRIDVTARRLETVGAVAAISGLVQVNAMPSGRQTRKINAHHHAVHRRRFELNVANGGAVRRHERGALIGPVRSYVRCSILIRRDGFRSRRFSAFSTGP